MTGSRTWQDLLHDAATAALELRKAEHIYRNAPTPENAAARDAARSRYEEAQKRCTEVLGIDE